eukprot:2105166-Rhodomonas_salina.1
MTVLLKQEGKRQDWFTTLSDAEMLAHPNYPPDAAVIPGDLACTAAAQAEVVLCRLDEQTALHKLLIGTCSESYSHILQSARMFPAQFQTAEANSGGRFMCPIIHIRKLSLKAC